MLQAMKEADLEYERQIESNNKLESVMEEKDKKIEKGIERARDKDTERETDKDLYIYGYIQYIERDTNI